MRGKFSLFWCLLLLFASFVLVNGMNVNVIGDSSLYASIAKQIGLTGNAQELYLFGQDYFQKPHLLFWLSALSFKAFGFSSFAFKLPSVLIGLSGVLGLYLIGKELYSKQLGFYAAFLWLFSLPFLLHVNDIHMDTMLSGFLVFVAYFIVLFLKRKKMKWLYISVIFMGLATITKGPIGLFIPLSGLLITLLFHYKEVRISFANVLGVVTLFLLIISPVLFFIHQQHGLQGIQFFFWKNQVSRIVADSLLQRDFFFYFHTLLWFFLPWSLLAFYSVFLRFKAFFRGRSSILWTYFLATFSTFFFVASFSSQQAPHYILSLLPFLSLLSAKTIVDAFENDRLNKVVQWLILIPLLLLPIVIIGLLVLFPPQNWRHWLPLVMSLLLVYLISRERMKLKRFILWTGVGMLMLFSSLNVQVFKDFLQPLDAPVNAIRYFEQHYPNEKLVYVKGKDHSAARIDFYGQTPIHFFHYDEEPSLPLGTSYLIVDDESLIYFKQKYSRLRTLKDFEFLRLTSPFESFKRKISKKQELDYYYLIEIEQ